MRRSGLTNSARSLSSVTALALAGCAADSDTPQNIFDPKGSQAQKINDLQVPVFIVAGIVGVIVIVMVGVILYMFRAKKHPAEEVPTQIHGHSKLEIAWTILPGVILLPSPSSLSPAVFDLAKKPNNAVDVNVIGQQWWWEFEYPTRASSPRTRS